MTEVDEKQSDNKSQAKYSTGSRILDFKAPAGTAFLEILNASLMQI